MRSSQVRFLLCLLCLARDCVAARANLSSVTPFPEKALGVWMPTETPQSVLGPVAKYFLVANKNLGFSAQRDASTGDVWFTVLQGQLFRVSGDQMQYCFGFFGKTGELAEQSPFSVNSTSDTGITFCWRTGLRGMPTHKLGCAGCDCATITIRLIGADDLEFTFQMSPPIIHAQIKLHRAGPPRPISAMLSTMKDPYQQCTMKDHYGPNSWHPQAHTGDSGTVRLPGCAFALASKASKLQTRRMNRSTEDGKCWQLNGVNLRIHRHTCA